MSKEIQISEFKEQCLKLFDNFSQNNQELLVTKRGRVIAKVTPILDPLNGSDFFGLLKSKAVIKNDIISPVEDGWNATR